MLRSSLFVLAVAVSAIGFRTASCFAGKIHFPSEVNGEEIWYIIKTDRILKTPAWEDFDEQVPLSAGAAINIARRSIDQVHASVKEEGWRNTPTRVDYAKLAPFGSNRWYWIIRFEKVHGRMGTGIPYMTCVVVLMDGSVVLPQEPADESGTKKDSPESGSKQ